MLQSKDMVHGLPPIKAPSEVRGECCAAKQARNSFKSELPIDGAFLQVHRIVI
ncbi:hypothetical protein A2U01_0106663, partial [Trifolium medium]|nr:hypothetical protein [Trifolium medium]